MYSRILVPIDMSSPESGQRSCPKAAELSKAWDAQVQLLTVMPGYKMPMVASFFPANAVEEMRSRVSDEMDQLAKKFFNESPTINVRSGKRAQEILEEAVSWRADLIIFACRPKDALGGELMLGSCGTSVAERAPCSVLVAR